MASLNRCDFIGRCGKDPDTKFTASGMSVSNVSIACGEKFKNKSGEWEERTEWINLVFWGKLSEIVAQYVSKGSEIYVSGRMQTRKWDDKDGNTRYSTEINVDKMQMLGGKSDRSEAAAPRAPMAEQQYESACSDEDIPF